MERARRDLLLETLEQLEEETLQRLEDKLSEIELKEGYRCIPLARLTHVDPPALTNLLLSSYGEDYGMETAGEVLRLQWMVAGPLFNIWVEPAGAVAAVHLPHFLWEHFVDRHRAELIQRVCVVDGVLDMLCGTVLDNEQYQSIRLYELMPSWNRVCKDRLYQVLKAKHKFLIEELEGK
uniref:Uncharacterized protein n=1 Tax=Chelonoidis abingdonii TaxID=106734 RepID=A0A8C0H4V6_CHEAB